MNINVALKGYVGNNSTCQWLYNRKNKKAILYFFFLTEEKGRSTMKDFSILFHEVEYLGFSFTEYAEQKKENQEILYKIEESLLLDSLELKEYNHFLTLHPDIGTIELIAKSFEKIDLPIPARAIVN